MEASGKPLRRESKSAADNTLARVRAYLRSSGLRPHRRLPPERLLAEELGVSRSTLRVALENLEAEGWIYRHVGRGTFIAPGLSQAARLREAANPSGPRQPTPLELLDARLVLEPTLAAAAALAAGPAAIEAMQRCVDKGGAAPSLDLYEKWDAALHAQIASATNNPVLIACLEPIVSLRRDPSWRVERTTLLSDGGFTEYRDRQFVMHQAILDAIAARDARGAREAMMAHLQDVRAMLLRKALSSE